MAEGYQPSGLTPEEFAALPPYDEIAGKTFSEVSAIYGEDVAIHVIIATDPDCWVPTEAEFAQARPAIEIDPDLVNAYLAGKSNSSNQVSAEITVNAVLGIDAAWSEANPSGVALIRQLQHGTWECVAVAPSYEAFLQLAEGKNVNWEATPVGGLPEPGRLLKAAARLLKNADVTLVTLDMPISNKPITTRRYCDDAISRAFGREKCGTHSITKNSPVQMFENLRASLDSRGYHLVTQTSRTSNDGMPVGATIEVYPHPAIVRLLNLDCRLKYKVDKAKIKAGRGAYWPNATLPERKQRLCENLRLLHTRLAAKINGIPEDLVPLDGHMRSWKFLKRYEDALDALVCGWVGACYLEGRAECFGDADAAIWVPTKGHHA